MSKNKNLKAIYRKGLLEGKSLNSVERYGNALHLLINLKSNGINPYANMHLKELLIRKKNGEKVGIKIRRFIIENYPYRVGGLTIFDDLPF